MAQLAKTAGLEPSHTLAALLEVAWAMALGPGEPPVRATSDVQRAAEEAGGAESVPVARPKAARCPGTCDPRLPPPGTVLERAHEGGMVCVSVLEHGSEYAGRTYGSLSAAARATTGTQWNGLLFFGFAPALKSYAVSRWLTGHP